MALEESLNVKLVLIPDNEDPDSYVRKVGAHQFRNFILHNKKDFILFQLEVSLKDAGADTNKKSEVVNQIAETISKIDKTEDFTKQQDYIRQCSQILNIDEAGFTSLVNKFIRNRISLQENKLPFDTAKYFEENARKGEESGFNDYTFELLYQDELQEREIVRVLLEHGKKEYENKETIAHHILAVVPHDELIQNKSVLKILHLYQKEVNKGNYPDKSFFIYHSDQDVNTLAVSLLQIKYEESEHWKSELSASSGYQPSLTKQAYSDYMFTIKNSAELNKFLNLAKDTSKDEAHSALIFLQLKKVIHLIRELSSNFERNNPTQEQLQDPSILSEMRDLIAMQHNLKEEQKRIVNGYKTVITMKPI
jgi:DNA primase